MHKSKIINQYVTFRNYVGKGQDLYKFVETIIKSTAYGIIIYNGIKWLHFIPSWPFYSMGIILVLIYYLTGRFWDTSGGFQIENEWGNERNPSIQEIKKQTKTH